MDPIKNIKLRWLHGALHDVSHELSRSQFSRFAHAWEPAINAYRCKTCIRICVDLAGVDRSVIDLTVEPRRVPEELSILPMRGFVVFPGTVVPLNVQRAASLKLLDETLPRTKVIGLLTQRDETKEDPEQQDLHSVGTAALVLKLLRQSDDHVVVIAQGLRRFSVRKIIATSPFLRAEVDLPKAISPPLTKES